MGNWCRWAWGWFSALFFVLGLINLHTHIDIGRLTNMSTLLWSAAVIVFLIRLLSEQITNLTYTANRGRDR